MHDLLRSLALFLRGDESAILNHDEQSLNISPLTKIRYLSVINMGERVPDVMKQQQCLRTLMIQGSPETKIVGNEIVEKLRLLRIIHINDIGLESLPDSLGNLLHLRHLDLDRTKIKELPKSIGCLVNLQKLSLSDCEFLCTLPKAITKLCNLRCLCLKGTPLTHVPKGISKLKHLNYLQGFVVGHDDTSAQDEEGCDLEELYSLSKLRFLEVDKLERAQAGGASVLADCHFMRTLILKCKEYDQEEAASHRIEKTYDVLSPPSTLQRLVIIRFFGAAFPNWIMSPSASFPNLTSIELLTCRSCSLLPPLGMFPQLKSLWIRDADAITTIGPEFLGPRASSAAVAFPKLERLSFKYMCNWEEWSFGMMEGVEEERRGAPKSLPRLRELFLSHCPKLRVLPEALRHATKLQKLYIRYTRSLIEVNNLPSQTEMLSILSAPMLERVSNLPSLKHLQIRDCSRLQHVENLNKLQRLSLWLVPSSVEGPSETSTANDDGQTQCLPEWLLGLLGQHQNASSAALQNLREFYLQCSTPLLKTFLKDGSNWPLIQWIPEVTVFGFDDRSYIWYTKAPPTFEAKIEEPEESDDSMDLPSHLL